MLSSKKVDLNQYESQRKITVSKAFVFKYKKPSYKLLLFVGPEFSKFPFFIGFANFKTPLFCCFVGLTLYRVYFKAPVPLTINKSCFGSQYSALRSIHVWSLHFGLEHRNHILGTQLLFKNEIPHNRGIYSQSSSYPK